MASTDQRVSGYYQLKREVAEERLNPPSLCNQPASPSIWFSRRFPQQSDRYGCPIIEFVVVDQQSGVNFIRPTALNDLFFAAILSDSRLGHSVVFCEPEQQWYYLEPLDQQYHPTSEAKLTNLLLALLLKCAEEMPANVDKYSVAVTLRDEELLKSIVKKARSLLAADSSFFSSNSPNKRIEGPEQPGRAAKMFISTALEPKPKARITLNETFDAFRQYCINNGLEAVQRREFKRLIAEVIKEEFGFGLRHDVVDPSGRQQQGWVGLGLKDRLEFAGNSQRN